MNGVFNLGARLKQLLEKKWEMEAGRRQAQTLVLPLFKLLFKTKFILARFR